MNKQDTIKGIKKYKVISIIRWASKESIIPVMQALESGGIKFAEITFDQSGRVSDSETAEMIMTASEKFKNKISVGAGTVMTEKQVEIAREAGAEFIISPNTDKAVIEKTVKLGMVSIPGAFTPTEIANADKYGADFVKLFPMVSMDINYIKAISAPLNYIGFLAVGGVNAENMNEYFNCGICGLGIGSDIVNKKLIESKNYEAIKENALKYTGKIGENI